MTLRLGLVGCGRISHAHGIAAKRLVNGPRFVACADVRGEAAQAFAQQYKCDNYYTDFSQMLKHEQLDGVVLATWPAQHREQIELSIKAGVHHILCEKALATSGQEALEIFGLAERTGTTIVEAFMYRHHPAMTYLDSLVRSERAGEIDSVRASFHMLTPDLDTGNRNWRQRKEAGGGVTFDRTCYAVNACAHYAASLPRFVSATGSVSKKYDTIVQLYGLVSFENGRTGLIETSNSTVFNQELQVSCAKRVFRLHTPFTLAGDIRIDEYAVIKFAHVEEQVHTFNAPLPLQDDLPSFYAYTAQLDTFAKVISGLAMPYPPLIESVVNTYILEALASSVVTRHVVEVDLPDVLRNAWEKTMAG